MANTRELSQLASLINVIDENKSIGIVTEYPNANVGIGTLSPTAKVDVVGDAFVSGIVTASSFVGDGSGLTIPLSALSDVNTSNLSGITTDYLMVYDPSVPGFKFVNPKTYFGINNDANPAPNIVDYGSY